LQFNNIASVTLFGMSRRGVHKGIPATAAWIFYLPSHD